MDAELVKRYVELKKELDSVKAEESSLRQDLSALEEQITEGFIEDGVQRMTVDGKTVYLHNRKFFGFLPELKEQGVAAAVQFWPHLRTVNAQSLQAALSEYEDAEGDIPDELKGLVKQTEVVSLRVKRA